MKKRALLPYGNITTVTDLGKIVHERRKELSLNQSQLARYSGVGLRFISELENGKPTLESQKVLNVLQTLGLSIQIILRQI